MFMKEIIKMVQVLLEMGTDEYEKCKYAFLVGGQEFPNLNAFFKTLFEVTDEKRPLSIEMKKSGAE